MAAAGGGNWGRGVRFMEQWEMDNRSLASLVRAGLMWIEGNGRAQALACLSEGLAREPEWAGPLFAQLDYRSSGLCAFHRHKLAGGIWKALSDLPLRAAESVGASGMSHWFDMASAHFLYRERAQWVEQSPHVAAFARERASRALGGDLAPLGLGCEFWRRPAGVLAAGAYCECKNGLGIGWLLCSKLDKISGARQARRAARLSYARALAQSSYEEGKACAFSGLLMHAPASALAVAGHLAGAGLVDLSQAGQLRIQEAGREGRGRCADLDRKAAKGLLVPGKSCSAETMALACELAAPGEFSASREFWALCRKADMEFCADLALQGYFGDPGDARRRSAIEQALLRKAAGRAGGRGKEQGRL